VTGNHTTYHEHERAFIANTRLENAVKDRCIEQARSTRDISEEESSK